MDLPTPPAPRIAYDIDGSVVLFSDTSGVEKSPVDMTLTDPAAVQHLNSNQTYGLAVGTGLWSFPEGQISAGLYYAKNWIAVMFPRPMDIKAWFFSARWFSARTVIIVTTNYYSVMPVEFQVSTDTTNGQDGTWTTIATKTEADYALPYQNINTNVQPLQTPPYGIGSPNYPSSSLEIYTGADLMYQDNGPTGPGWEAVSGGDGVRGVRLFFPNRPQADGLDIIGSLRAIILMLHLYGEPSAVSGKRLDLMNAAGTAPADLAFGDVDLATPVTRTVRVKNVSTTEDAIGVRLTAEDAIPLFFPPSHFSVRFSLDGENWYPSLFLGDIPAGALSQSVSLRVHPLPGTVGLHFARIHALAGDWS